MRRNVHAYARRLFGLAALLLLVGLLFGSLPAAAATGTTYKAEFYAEGELVATVPFSDPAAGFDVTIEVPKKEGYTGAWEPYTLGNADIQIHAVYTAIPGYQPPLDDGSVINFLVLLILILLVCILLLVILTLRARKILRANGLWGKGHAVTAKVQPNVQNESAPQDTPAAQEKTAHAEAEVAEENGKKSDASVEDHAGQEEAETCPASAEAGEASPTANATLSAAQEASNEECTKAPSQEQAPVPGEELQVAPCEEMSPVQEEQPESAVQNDAKQEQAQPDLALGKAAATASAFSMMMADGSEDELSTVLVGRDGRRVQVKYRQSFRARMMSASEESKGYYNDLKNYILSFEDVSCSDSQNYESFSGGRRPLAKMNISGKTMILYLALDPVALEGSKYKFENVGDRRRFEKTPVKVKVRSARSFKWAKELIDMTMAEAGRSFVSLREDVYAPDGSVSREELMRMGLIKMEARDLATGKKVDEADVLKMIEEGAVPEGRKMGTPVFAAKEETAPDLSPAIAVAAVAAASVIAADGDDGAEDASALTEGFTLADMPMMANVTLLPEEEVIPQVESVTAEEAETLIENVVATQHIEHVAAPQTVKGSQKRGKAAVLNIDLLDRHYAAGETVTLARLKADGLLPRNAQKLKILAHGSLSKPLTVEADAFSLTAVKMILLTGGHAVLDDE